MTKGLKLFVRDQDCVEGANTLDFVHTILKKKMNTTIKPMKRKKIPKTNQLTELKNIGSRVLK